MMKNTFLSALAGVLLFGSAEPLTAQLHETSIRKYPIYTTTEYGVVLSYYGKTKEETIDLSGRPLRNVDNGAFYDCLAVKKLRVGRDFYRFDTNSLIFRNPTLEKIEVEEGNKSYIAPEGVLYNIDESGKAFKLRRFPPAKAGAYEILEGVTSIDYNAFHNCENITSLRLPHSMKNIPGNRALSDCHKLERIDMVKDNDYLKSVDGVLYEYRYENQQAAQGLREVWLSVFPAGKRGTYVLPANVTQLRNQYMAKRGPSFGNIDNIQVAEGSSHFKSIEGVLFNHDGTILMAFPGARGGEYRVPEGVTTIAQGAFTHCRNLTTLHLPKSFQKFDFLHKDYAGVKVRPIFEGCTQLANISVDEANPNFKSEGGVLYSKTGETLVLCPPAKTGVFVVPDGVTNIAEAAFYACTQLTDIRLPWSLTTIGLSSFVKCDGITNFSTPYLVEKVEGFHQNARPLSLTAIYNFAHKRNFRNSEFRGDFNPLCTWWEVPYYYVNRGGDLAFDGYRSLSRTAIQPPTTKLVDGENYDKKMREYYPTLSYTRNFTNTHWQPLYLPCDVAMEDLVQYCEVAELVEGDAKGFNARKLNAQEMVKRYQPYVIRAKQAGNYTFNLRNVMLDVAEEKSKDIAVGNATYRFVSNWTRKAGLKKDGLYVMKNGRLRPLASSQGELPALRWYLQAPEGANVEQLALRIDGALPTALGGAPSIESSSSLGVFSVDGRRQQRPLQELPAGIYIVNGQKVVK